MDFDWPHLLFKIAISKNSKQEFFNLFPSPFFHCHGTRFFTLCMILYGKYETVL